MIIPDVDFQTEPPPKHYALAFEPFLYNQEAYLQLKEGERYSFYAVDHAQQHVLARIHFLLVPDERGARRAVSLPQSPFGSVECAACFNEAILYAFLCFVIEYLTNREVQEVTIKHYASAYQPTATEALRHVFSKLNFSTSEAITNSHISVDEEKIDRKLSAGQIGRLKKCQRMEFVVQEDPPISWEKIYNFVNDSYASRGRKLSMDKNTLGQHLEAMPGCYQFFSVYHRGELIAAAIVVRVHLHILYTYSYTAHASYSSYSPTVLLLSKIYNYCYQQKIKILDLGTSLTDSVEDFKRRMGGVFSAKRTYSRG